MNIARDKTTGEVIDADDLRILGGNIDKHNYECVDKNCRVQMTACSFEPTHKQRPHFRAIGVEHASECTYSEYHRLLNQGHKGRVEFGKVPYPSRLVDTSKKEQVTPPSIKKEQAAADGSGRTITRSDGWLETSDSNRNVSTINQIVDFYVACPYNRDFNLNVYETTQTYSRWFFRIPFNKPNDGKLYYERKIFRGTLSMKKDAVQEDDKKISIQLSECEKWSNPVQGKSRDPINPYIIEIDKGTLSSYRISRVLNQLEMLRDEKIGDFKSGTDSNKDSWIFFLADPPNDDSPYHFRVIDGHLIARYVQIPDTVKD